MTAEKLVSVIMPVYNGQRFIGEAIQSVLSQTYADFELIIVDDGSTDTTKPVVENFLTLDPRIRYFYQENGKQGKARNKGMENSRGDLIAFLDADDVWLPDFLEQQLFYINTCGSDMVFSLVGFIDEESTILEGRTDLIQRDFHGISGIKALLQGNCIPILTVLARRLAIIKAGTFSESAVLQYGEDYRLWLNMLKTGSTLSCNYKVLAYYRRHAAQSSKVAILKYMQMIRIIKDVDSAGIEREKNQAIKIWLKRYMYSKEMTGRKIRSVQQFFPSRTIGIFLQPASYFLSPKIIRAILTILYF